MNTLIIGDGGFGLGEAIIRQLANQNVQLVTSREEIEKALNWKESNNKLSSFLLQSVASPSMPHPTGQESRRKRREAERKSKK